MSQEHRERLVEQAIESLDGIDDLPVEEQHSRLAEAQELLSAVLHNQGVSQLGIPGVG